MRTEVLVHTSPSIMTMALRYRPQVSLRKLHRVGWESSKELPSQILIDLVKSYLVNEFLRPSTTQVQFPILPGHRGSERDGEHEKEAAAFPEKTREGGVIVS